MSHDLRPLAADDRVGEYEIDASIGVGGMGKVYRATAGDGTPVALKVVKEDLAGDATFRRRFEREARIAQTVRNLHVVSVRDIGEHDGLPFLVARLIEGVTLDEKLKLEGLLGLATTVMICGHVAAGLQALWEAGMVHRDVKSANILLDVARKGYITDFGLATDSDASVLTRPEQTLRSMDHMSPEQIRGEAVTGAADTYSLGCVVFECVASRPPFADHRGMRVLWAHLQDEPRDPPPQQTDLPSAFTEALKALLREPAERPPTSIDYPRSLVHAAGIPIVDGAT